MKFKKNIKIDMTMDCPIEGCEERFSGDIPEIMKGMLIHCVMIHEGGKFDNYLNNIDAQIDLGT